MPARLCCALSGGPCIASMQYPRICSSRASRAHSCSIPSTDSTCPMRLNIGPGHWFLPCPLFHNPGTSTASEMPPPQLHCALLLSCCQRHPPSRSGTTCSPTLGDDQHAHVPRVTVSGRPASLRIFWPVRKLELAFFFSRQVCEFTRTHANWTLLRVDTAGKKSRSAACSP